MHITGRVWRALTNIERLAMLESAVKENTRLWQKKKPPTWQLNKTQHI